MTVNGFEGREAARKEIAVACSRELRERFDLETDLLDERRWNQFIVESGGDLSGLGPATRVEMFERGGLERVGDRTIEKMRHRIARDVRNGEIDPEMQNELVEFAELYIKAAIDGAYDLVRRDPRNDIEGVSYYFSGLIDEEL